MKILFDHQIFSSLRVGGISRYHVELVKHFDNDVQWKIPLFFSNNLHLAEIMDVPGFFPKTKFRGRDRILEYINRQRTAWTLMRGDFDVFHPTFYDSSLLGRLRGRPMVLTVHDMIHDRFPRLPAAGWETREKRLMAERASQIIVPSKFTADELVKLYGIPAKKIHVVHHGAPSWRISAENPAADCFLFVGGRNYYKNFGRLLKAMRLVPESRLRVVGAPFSREERTLISRLELDSRIEFAAARNDEELAGLYASSAAFVFPSKMEGFGLPVLEAFAAGCPALLADIPVFREIGGDAALYFDPDSEHALADCMRQILRRRMTGGIAGQLRRFSWRKCARETCVVYRLALSLSGKG